MLAMNQTLVFAARQRAWLRSASAGVQHALEQTSRNDRQLHSLERNRQRQHQQSSPSSWKPATFPATIDNRRYLHQSVLQNCRTKRPSNTDRSFFDKDISNGSLSLQSSTLATLSRSFHQSSFQKRQKKESHVNTGRSAVVSMQRPVKSKYPTLAQAKELPMVYQHMDNVSLVTLAGLGEHAARREVLIRHIMAVDEVEYDIALETFGRIEEANHQGKYLLGLPFQLGAATLMVSGMASIPMVFHLKTVAFFNDHFVTADVPPPGDLETWLEVGAWSWNWMEPLLGTASFILLCVQYFRINMDHLGFRPYTHRIKRMRGERLAQQFPRYDGEVLMKYSETAAIYKQ